MEFGQGEHVYLQIRKRGVNTEWLGRQLADQLGIHPERRGLLRLKRPPCRHQPVVQPVPAKT